MIHNLHTYCIPQSLSGINLALTKGEEMADAGRRNAEILRSRIVARMEQVSAEAADLQAQLENVDAFLDMLSQYEALQMSGDEGVEQEKQLPPVENRIVAAAKGRKRPKNPDRETVVQLAYELIDLQGRPMGRAELFEQLANQGVVILGKDPEMVLSTMLWRSKDKIVRLDKFGYWMADKEYEPAKYNPLV